MALTASDTLFTRLVRGALTATVILLLADFAWHVMKTVIDRKLAEAQNLGEPNTEDARRRARMRTLLPILRNILFVTLLAMAAMMALSALGVEIGPLIAGAGVVGVAIGFGAQTVVKDIISGMFYLLDDAFRVGEYIQSGSYKGTVESFSLRSVKLRHQRGPHLHGAVRRARRDSEHEPRLGDRKAEGGRHLRHRSRQGEDADQADRQGAGAGPGVGAAHHRNL